MVEKSEQTTLDTASQFQARETPIKEVKKIPIFMTAAVTEKFDAENPVRCVNFIESWKGPQEEDLKADEMIVRMLWSSVNQNDFKMNTGKMPLEWVTVRPPFVGGRDGCGEIVALGSEANKYFKTHDIVMGTCNSFHFGTFGQYSIFKMKDICLKPRELSIEHAAAMPMVLLTAWECFESIKDPRSLKRILIHGGAGGVGSWLILLAKFYFNIPHVITTCRGVNCDYVKNLGADEVINYLEYPNFDDWIMDKYKNVPMQQQVTTTTTTTTAGAPLDCVLDTIGGDVIMDRSYKLLDKNGYFITTVPIQHFDSSHSVNKELVGYSWTYLKNKLASVFTNNPTFYSVMYKPDGNKLRNLVDWVVQNKLDDKIQIIKYPFKELTTALEVIHSGHVDGKIVLDMSLVV